MSIFPSIYPGTYFQINEFQSNTAGLLSLGFFVLCWPNNSRQATLTLLKHNAWIDSIAPGILDGESLKKKNRPNSLILGQGFSLQEELLHKYIHRSLSGKNVLACTEMSQPYSIAWSFTTSLNREVFVMILWEGLAKQAKTTPSI